jgi:MarR family transcriptional regulator, lower aerobic nicotinate degradation pathway regulator
VSRPSPPVPTDVRLPGPLADSPGFVLMQVGRLAMEWTTEALALLELNLHEFATLMLVYRMGGISQAAIADRLGISKAAVSELATDLEARGLAERRPHRFDRRRRALYVTPGGSELLAEAADELAAIDAQFADKVGEEAIRALSELPPPRLTPVEEAMRAAGLPIRG